MQSTRIITSISTICTCAYFFSDSPTNNLMHYRRSMAHMVFPGSQEVVDVGECRAEVRGTVHCVTDFTLRLRCHRLT